MIRDRYGKPSRVTVTKVTPRPKQDKKPATKSKAKRDRQKSRVTKEARDSNVTNMDHTESTEPTAALLRSRLVTGGKRDKSRDSEPVTRDITRDAEAVTRDNVVPIKEGQPVPQFTEASLLRAEVDALTVTVNALRAELATMQKSLDGMRDLVAMLPWSPPVEPASVLDGAVVDVAAAARKAQSSRAEYMREWRKKQKGTLS